MTGQSTCPAAADGLIALFTAAAGGVLVTDGMGITDPEATEVIQVGFVATDDESFAEGACQSEGAGGNRDREQYDVHCAVIVLDADGDQRAARQRAFALLAMLRGALIATRAIAPGVINASITNWAYRADKTDAGPRAELRFDVNCDAYTEG